MSARNEDSIQPTHPASLDGKWTRKTIAVYGMVMGSFGVMTIVISILARIAFFDYYNSLSVVANTTQIQLMMGLITAMGTGVMVGGYLLAFNAWKELTRK
jgi:hypothetical protein